MHRFYAAPASCAGPTVRLEGAEAHHAMHVVRMRVGERAVVLDGVGTELDCEVLRFAGDSLELRVKQRQRVEVPPYRVTLVQAVVKGRSMETILQKATELGASRIVPVISERTVSQFDAEGGGHRADRWRSTIVEAAKQCGSAWFPGLDLPAPLTSYLAQSDENELSLVASLQPGARHPRVWLEGFVAEQNRPPGSVRVFVGPEGDFTPAELNVIRGAGALPMTLGRRILRSETAAIYCLSVLGYELEGRFGS